MLKFLESSVFLLLFLPCGAQPYKNVFLSFIFYLFPFIFFKSEVELLDTASATVVLSLMAG